MKKHIIILVISVSSVILGSFVVHMNKDKNLTSIKPVNSKFFKDSVSPQDLNKQDLTSINVRSINTKENSSNTALTKAEFYKGMMEKSVQAAKTGDYEVKDSVHEDIKIQSQHFQSRLRAAAAGLTSEEIKTAVNNGDYILAIHLGTQTYGAGNMENVNDIVGLFTNGAIAANGTSDSQALAFAIRQLSDAVLELPALDMKTRKIKSMSWLLAGKEVLPSSYELGIQNWNEVILRLTDKEFDEARKESKNLVQVLYGN